MRRTLLCCAGAALILSPLAACGDDDDAGTPSSTSAGGAAGDELHVGALDSLKFDQDAYEVEAGAVDVVYENIGSIAHTLLIRDVDDFKLAVSGSGDIDEGDVELEPGTYTLYCDVAGHEAAGMVADLTVE